LQSVSDEVDPSGGYRIPPKRSGRARYTVPTESASPAKQRFRVPGYWALMHETPLWGSLLEKATPSRCPSQGFSIQARIV
jgi:hypothetical protein